jgi:general secretion pathway protein A
MYAEHFGLNEKPFSISPDPRYLYMSRLHADALAHLLYGIVESGGFIQLTGEVGTGKTTLIRSVLEQLPDKTEIALILNPDLSKREFLQAICQELGVPFAANDSAKALVDRLNGKLLRAHAEDRRVVLIVDEAQTMSPELLEQVRLLTNLETVKKKLLQIILIGQPELRDLLGRPEMRQIAQRITGRYHLEPLSAADTALYVEHRIKVAGGRPEVFSKRAVRKLFRLSRGIPRLINVIADRALLAAYSRDTSRIDARLVRLAAAEVFGRSAAMRWWPLAAAACALAFVLWVAASFDDGLPAALELVLLGTAAPETPAVSVDAAVSSVEAAAGAAALLGAADSTRLPTASPLEAEVAAPEPPSLAGLLTSAAIEADGETATAALFGLWDLRYSPTGGPVCAQAEAAGLQCFWLDGGSISELRRLNRPVRMSLIDASGTEHVLVLSGLDRTHAAIAVEDRTIRVGIADLTHYAYGRHLMLWRPAIGVASGPLAEGASGPAVVWLRTGLEELTGIDLASAEPDRFDSDLALAVRAFQRERGLVVDGVVGSRTLINLQTELGLIGVRLVPEAH